MKLIVFENHLFSAKFSLDLTFMDFLKVTDSSITEFHTLAFWLIFHFKHMKTDFLHSNMYFPRHNWLKEIKFNLYIYFSAQIPKTLHNITHTIIYNKK